MLTSQDHLHRIRVSLHWRPLRAEDSIPPMVIIGDFSHELGIGMKILFFTALLSILTGCTQESDQLVRTNLNPPPSIPPAEKKNLLDARSGFSTTLVREIRDSEPMPEPPPDLFSLIQYETDLGPMNALMSKPAESEPGKKSPAIIWPRICFAR